MLSVFRLLFLRSLVIGYRPMILTRGSRRVDDAVGACAEISGEGQNLAVLSPPSGCETFYATSTKRHFELD